MTEQTTIEHPPTVRRKMTPLKIASIAGFAAGALMLVCGLALLLFLDPIVNRIVRPRITEAFAKAYPAYSIRIAGMNYNVLKNSIGFDSVALSAADSTFTGTMATLSVSGIRWMHLLWGGSLAPHDFDNAIINAQTIALTFPRSKYELGCERLHASIGDSVMTADALDIHPAVDDEEVFAGSKFRTTRFHLTTPQCRLTGVAFLDALTRKYYHARSVHVRDIALDILINKDKPAERDSSSPSMPGVALSSMKESLRCDTLAITNGTVSYGERFGIKASPAVITFDSVDVLAEGIANHTDRDTTLVIHAKGIFMKAAMMTLLMTFPVPSPEFSFHYSGTLGRMQLSALNVFLEKAEQKRIKSGALHSATFEIKVVSGRASGNVRALYRDLTFAVLNKQTGSEKGFVDGITSFIANNFKIHGTNMPGESGPVQVGNVKYLRQRGDPFFGFVWFALRSGVADVVGF